MITPLPMVTAPLPGESWYGYVHRVAQRYRVDWSDLLGNLVPQGRRLFRYAHTGRALGVVATTKTQKLAANYFGLPRRDVTDLFLNKYTTFLGLTEDLIASLDPLAPLHNPSRATPWGFKPLQARAQCTQCSQGSGVQWQTTWLLTVHRYCVVHGLPLTDRSRKRVAAPPTVDDLDAQLVILEALKQPDLNADLLQRWASTINRHPALPLALVVAPSAPSEIVVPHLWRFSSCPPLSVAKHLMVVEETLRFPSLVPVDIYYGDLSDLSYPLPLTSGRKIARTTIQMYATGQTLAQATNHLRFHVQRQFVQFMDELEFAGRLERYWEAIARAAEEMTQDPTDYPQRDRLVRTETARRYLRSTGQFYDRQGYGGWLIERWACAYTGYIVSNPPAFLDDLERRVGHELRDALSYLEAS